MHFNAPGDFEVISPDSAPISARRNTPSSGRRSIGEWVKEFGLEVIGMRGLRDELRARRG